MHTRDNLEAPEWCEPCVREILFHRVRALNVPGMDNHDPLEFLFGYKSGDLLAGAFEDRVVRMHPVQVVIQKDDFELLPVKGLECQFGVLGEYCLWQALAEP